MTQDASNDTPVSSRTRIATSARIAPGVVVNGPCEIGEECQVDAGVVLETENGPVEIPWADAGSFKLCDDEDLF